MKAPKGNILKIKGKVKGVFLKSCLTCLPLCYSSCFTTYCIGLNHQASSSIFQARRYS